MGRAGAARKRSAAGDAGPSPRRGGCRARSAPPASWVESVTVDGLVDVRPFRVVVHLLGDQRGPRHEAEGLVEVGEGEGPGDRVAAVDRAPAGKALRAPRRVPRRSASRPSSAQSSRRPARRPRADRPPRRHRARRRPNSATRRGRSGRPRTGRRRSRRAASGSRRCRGALPLRSRARVTCGVNFRPSGGRPMRCRMRSCSACSSSERRRRLDRGDDRVRLARAERADAGEAERKATRGGRATGPRRSSSASTMSMSPMKRSVRW